MTKATGSLAAAVLALGLLSQPGAAFAWSAAYPPQPVAWIVGPGYSTYSGYPWPSPPFSSPILTPAYGCYVTHALLKGAWRRVEVCS
jgi:hypothetical protein